MERSRRSVLCATGSGLEAEMTGPRLILVALAVAFGVAVTFATLTTVKQVHTSSVAPHATRI